jgi:hypothetical protein
LGVDELTSALRDKMPGCPVMIPVRVWPQALGTSDETRPVSMSWWLSGLVQRHLHQQTEGEKNDNQNQRRLQAIWNVMRTASSCTTSPPR